LPWNRRSRSRRAPVARRAIRARERGRQLRGAALEARASGASRSAAASPGLRASMVIFIRGLAHHLARMGMGS
jgi:hypothetical protein